MIAPDGTECNLTLEEALVEYKDVLDHIRESLVDDVPQAARAWRGFTQAQRIVLNRAASKGGPFTVQEGKIMATQEFRDHFGYTGPELL